MAATYWAAIEAGLQSKPPDVPAIGSNLHLAAYHCAIELQAGLLRAPLPASFWAEATPPAATRCATSEPGSLVSPTRQQAGSCLMQALPQPLCCRPGTVPAQVHELNAAVLRSKRSSRRARSRLRGTSWPRCCSHTRALRWTTWG